MSMKTPALRAMLEKLGPMAMMEENGERAAAIAMALLEKRATEGPLALELIEADGVKIIVQTSVLHPVPDLRRQATVVLGACLAEQQPSFVEAALQNRVPMALLRLLNEEDRRVKPKEEQEAADAKPAAAIDPDLPIRRVAIVALKNLMAGDGVAEKILKADPTFTPNLLKAGGNTDATNRLGALAIALSLARDERLNATVQEAAELDAAAAVEMLMRATCLDEGSEAAEASDTAVQLMLSLRASTALRDELVQAEAHEKFGELLARKEPPLEAERAGRLKELCSWLAPPAA